MVISEIFRWIWYNLRYVGHPPWDTGISPPELHAFIQKTSPGRALDLGAGTGTNMATLAEAGWEAEGVEFALIAVQAARRKLKKLGHAPKVYCRDVTEIGFLTRKYDLVLDIGCFHSLSGTRRLKYLDNLKKLLAVNGTFLLYAFYSHLDDRVGIREDEINDLGTRYTLISRQMGLDAGTKESVWLEFRNINLPPQP